MSMDKCREAFEQICYQNKWNINKDGHGFYVDDFVNGAWWAYESRQAEVDEQHKINVALNSETIKQREKIRHYMSQCVEKDKRIENLISKWRTDAEQASKKSSEDWAENILNYCADDLEKALRGEHE